MKTRLSLRVLRVTWRSDMTWYFLLLCLLKSKYRTGCEISGFPPVVFVAVALLGYSAVLVH